MANQWFRMYSEFATDAKVQMMPENLQRRLLMLFCFRCNGDVTLQDNEVTFQLRISNEEWMETKAEFIKRGFIDSDNKILNWDKRQYKSDSSAERVRRHREAKKQDNVTSCNVTVTPPEQNRTDKENIIKEKLPPKRKPKITLAAWEEKNGIIRGDQFSDFGQKHKLSESQIDVMVEKFRARCEAHDYRYSDFPKAFRTWEWDETIKQLRQSTVPSSQQAYNRNPG